MNENSNAYTAAVHVATIIPSFTMRREHAAMLGLWRVGTKASILSESVRDRLQAHGPWQTQGGQRVTLAGRWWHTLIQELRKQRQVDLNSELK